jgi:hypothetical protein
MATARLRATRAKTVHSIMEIAMMTFSKLGPRAEEIAIAKISCGKAMNISVIRINKSSIIPPK